MDDPIRYQLYGYPYTRSILTEMVLLECAISYDVHEVNIFENQHQADWYIKINPTGLIPCLITPQGDTLSEAPAINLYLADLHPESELSPPVDDKQRGEFLRGLFFLTNEIEPTLKRYFYPHRYARNQASTEQMEQDSLKEVIKLLEQMEARLSKKGPYCLGDRYSLVDLTLSFWIIYLEYEPSYAGFSNDDYHEEPFQHIKECVKRVTNRAPISAIFREYRNQHKRHLNL